MSPRNCNDWSEQEEEQIWKNMSKKDSDEEQEK
jgi:hypothetical protein